MRSAVLLGKLSGWKRGSLKNSKNITVLRKESRMAAVELGHRGGIIGGPARAKKLSPSVRSAMASKAAKARWAKLPISPR